VGASRRLTDTTGSGVIECHDWRPWARTSHLARHIALVAHADECILSTWDRDGDRVVTFGSHPVERGSTLEPAYALAAFPATRKVLTEMLPYVADVENPEADAAEVEYLRSIGHRTLVMLPLVVRGESIGIVELSVARVGADRRLAREAGHRQRAANAPLLYSLMARGRARLSRSRAPPPFGPPSCSSTWTTSEPQRPVSREATALRCFAIARSSAGRLTGRLGARVRP
jgi:hypothetical protein